MLKQLQWKLTLICVITTGIILSVMAVILLFTSESQVEKQMESTFQNSINSIVYKVQSSRIIEDTWLSQLEAGNSLIIHLEDQGTPIFFSGSWAPKTDRQELISEVQNMALATGFDVKVGPASVINVTYSDTFEVIGDQGERYFAATAAIPTDHSWMGLTVLMEKSDREKIILRFTFVGVIFAALILLFLFSLWFSRRAIKPIEESSRKQVEFVAAASHELRSPLSVIRAGLSTMALSNVPDETKKYLKTADRECLRMAGLIDDLLILAGADSGSWSVHFKPVEIDTLIMEIYEGFENVVINKNQKLQLQLPDQQLPMINGDKQRLWQAVSVLLDNAVAYTPEKGTITLSAQLSRKSVILSVADTGPGVPDEMKERVFERFFRADTSHTKKEHFGLGLSIAKEIVELHGGKITIGDTPGGGAAFQIKLPVMPVTATHCRST